MTKGTPAGTLRKGLHELEYWEDGQEWRWTNKVIGKTLEFGWTEEYSPKKWDEWEARIQHEYREAVRSTAFEIWMQKGGRNAEEAEAEKIGYEEQRFKKVREAWKKGDGTMKRILVGGFVSPAKLAVGKEEARNELDMEESPEVGPTLEEVDESRACLWCAQLGTLEHICWECEERPWKAPAVPVDTMQRRMGWPV